MTDPTRNLRLSRRSVLATVAASVAVSAPAVGTEGPNAGETTTAAAGYGVGGYGEGGYGDPTAAPGPGDVTGNGAAATDPDGDDLYEDVTGDGDVNVIDVAEFLDRFDGLDPEGEGYFDFTQDGNVDILDVAELLKET